MTVKPKKVLKLAVRGQLRGFPVPSSVDDDYAEAAELAEKNPKHPVIVHELPFTDDREAVRREAASAVKAQMAALNEDGDEPEPFHVGYVLDTEGSLYRTVVVYYPGGRPKRKRGGPDPEPPPYDDPDAPRGDSGSHFVYPSITGTGNKAVDPGRQGIVMGPDIGREPTGGLIDGGEDFDPDPPLTP